MSSVTGHGVSPLTGAPVSRGLEGFELFPFAVGCISLRSRFSTLNEVQCVWLNA